MRHAGTPVHLVVFLTCIILQHVCRTVGAGVEVPLCDGWYNNAAHPDYGSTGMPLSRDLPPAYSDDAYRPSGTDRPNPRLVSRALVKHLSNTAKDSGRTVLCVFFGQHVVDDISDVRGIACPTEYSNIALQPGDPLYNSAESDRTTKIMPFQRAVYKSGTGTSANNPRQQVNAATSWLDGSAIYGVSEAWQDRLRAFTNGSLRTSHGGKLPDMNVMGLPMQNLPSPKNQKIHKPNNLYALGNVRGNENPFLLAVSAVWTRWHNHWAHRLHTDHPEWTDDQVFQQAKRWVVATYQNIVLYEWLPAFINDTVEEYSGYNRFVDPAPSNVFTAAAMRYGHSMVPSAVFKRNSSGHAMPIRTCNTYWSAEDVIQTDEDVDGLLSGMAGQIADGGRSIVSEDLQGFLYGPLTFSRRDLVAMDIQRGRDHGLPDYNTACRQYGLAPLHNWTDIKVMNQKISDEMVSELSDLYGSVDKLDVWVGGMLAGAGAGRPGMLYKTIMKQQFLRLRDADRFWFENTQTSGFTEDELNTIRGINFKDILSRVTDVPSAQLQDDVFVWKNGCVFVIMVAAWRNELRTERRLQTPKKKLDLPSNAYQATEWQGRRLPTRQVVVTLQSPSLIEVRDTRDAVFRLVNIAKIARGIITVSRDRGCKFLSIHIPREYDLVLKFSSHHERETFLADLKQFLTAQQVPVELQEVELGQLQKQAVTIEDRQKTLEDFFCSVFLQALSSSRAVDDWVVQPEKWKAKSALDCELTKVEFAEAMSLRPDSQFVVQMFNLVDKDKNGYISFREFLDLVVIFSKGTMEDKLRVMFDMYDQTGNGYLSRKELTNMLGSLMELVSNNTTGRIEDLVESMFAEAGMEGEQDMSFDKFVSMMQDHKEELNQARLNIAGSDWTTLRPTRTSVPKESGRRRSSSMLPKGPWRLRRASAPVVSSGDVVSATRRKTSPKLEPIPSVPCAANTTDSDNVFTSDAVTAPNGKRRSTGRSSSDIKVQLLRETYPASAYQRKMQAFKRWVENKRLQLLYLIFYFAITFALFVERAYHYAVEAEDFGIRQLTQYGIIASRGAAASMSFSFSLLLLTMCRNSLTKLRETFLNRYIPFDYAVDFHKIVAITALVFTIIHTLGHLVNVYHFAVHPLNHLVCLFPSLRTLDNGSDQPPKWYWWAFQTMAGVTGVLLLLVVSIIYVFATGYARRRAFSAFWATHQLYIVMFILTVLHGSGRLIQNPSFHLYLIGPAIIFTLDKLVSISHRRQLVDIVKTELLPSDVTNIQFKRPDDFEYKSGQWVRIACPEQGPNEYHPMTLTSAPHENTLSVHVRAVGPWTAQLRRTYDPEDFSNGTQKLFLDGPFGEGHQDWYKYKIAVLVGGGIGITPFASILKDVAYLSSTGANMNCKKVYFLWVTRTQRHFEWFIDIIREVEEQDRRGLVAVHIFITQFFEKFDVRTTMLYIYERHFQRLSGRSLFTGLRATTHFGRPEFVSLLDSIQHQNPEVKKIGVFSCGPPGMTRNVEDACAQLNKKDLAHYVSYYENF
ncbi:dual oxidase 1-like isoform X2 [Branchiostoma floridae]|uniref:NAD(P)H oxidase (H2O2-forming) n=1 Tax=Branchiostoma floridae TaxID=7739 RepID=A0A9J7HNJ3_BRAFL|nr:dual oxidase 1-like isoform X2 [Branchiostoma floridae]